MSVRSLSQLAIRRDVAPPGNPIPAGLSPSAGQGGTPLPSGDAVTAYADALVAQIPTEVVAAYTAVMAVVAEVIPATDAYLPARVAIVVGTVVFAPAAVIAAYFASGGRAVKWPQGGGNPSRHVPLLEPLGAAIAAAAWALSTPTSPLAAALSGGGFAIAAACIVIGAATAMSFFAPWLRRGNSSSPLAPPVAATSRPAPGGRQR